MIKEARSLTGKEKTYVYCCLYHKRIKAYVSEDGYVAYDPDELEQFRNKAHRGRPFMSKNKIKANKGEEQ